MAAEKITPSEQEPLAELFSGMEVPDSSTREVLGQKLSTAYKVWYGSFGDTAKIAQANIVADSVGDTEGITLIRRGDYARDYHNRCAHFAFGEKMREAWASPGQELPMDFWLKPIHFLSQHGYLLISRPAPGDVVAYTRAIPEYVQSGGEPSFNHFGIVADDGTIISKWDQGPVVNHLLEVAPSSYGDSAYFFHRVEQPAGS